ncbi:MAG TPA: rRNA maturation RNase YbeY [Pyrinomonadaceae bacterium]|nr:rRNA maturation RNase YbeY [Pyrinomonadaceae bacterium]
MIEVVNRQRHRKIDPKHWAGFAQKALGVIGRDQQSVTIAFVSKRRIRELNKRFRGLDQVTDVLSFPTAEDAVTDSADKTLGDIAIAVEQAEEQARANSLAFELEIAQLILHGLLHLCGYDHETDDGEMDRLELRFRRKLGI